jgi:hypothetical protein
MLDPDGRIWIDRLTDGLANTGEWLALADGERIIRLVAHHVGADVHPSNRRDATKSSARSVYHSIATG